MNESTSHPAKPEHLNHCEDVNTAEPVPQNKSDAVPEGLKAKIVEDQCKRYMIQKTAIDNTYNVSVSETEVSINALLNTVASYPAHQAQLQRLQQLLAQKTSIEASMAKQLANLQATYEAHSYDVEMVLQRYMKEMK
ncbi:hypothetical protein PtrSN002B_000217 [Pyrenophora tritici-repentis]|uniref:Uncharacterized protein n=1 Tax=Pyrenophora tritici-repentis TaxID=45151 RepID=A0A2W1FI60_9PLEO|nr:hypothetical protein PtrV1_04257 [Pyrenophora tritici-repentis]KAF7451938.1 hypothetical protein A1F99_037150 [Pyrenophora tritici-repentis]KAF7574938.1 hypothetical protein PtrM4_065620 [Pyrenophora tritici-repentis]KAG9386294.1 hypothetical protein A1F94_003044 [Pyrenophora tritici-repentis]KAI0589920.1 hypothetical protein Alg215_00043 [Pyrenophora tritici-repentis]